MPAKHPFTLSIEGERERIEFGHAGLTVQDTSLTYAEAEALAAELAAAAKRLRTHIAVNRTIRARGGTPPAVADAGVDDDLGGKGTI
jgi:hypothetical protein